MINAPVGFRFNPTNEELARYYLADRVAGNLEDMWQGLINEFDMYTEEPWELYGRFYGPNLGGNNLVEAKSDKYIYLFTTLKKVSSDGNGKRVNRRVGKTGGTWHEQNAKKCMGEGGFSWCERHFSYKNDKDQDQDRAWLMTELCFHEDDILVLCRIGKKPLRVDKNNFTVQGTQAKRTRTEGMFSGSGISIVGGEQVQHHGGVGCGFGNQGSVMQEEVEADMGINAFDDLNGNLVVEGDSPISRNIGEPDHEDNVDILNLVDIVVGDMDELEEAMRVTYPEYYNNVNGGSITRIQEAEDKSIGTICNNDINLPGSTVWSDLDQCMINSLDEWIAELQQGGEQSPVQQMPETMID